MPLWNPLIVGGRPFHANAQSAVFGPFTCPPTCCRSGRRSAGSACSSCGWRRFGTFMLGRSLGMRFAGALLAGLVFAFNLKMVTWLSTRMGVWT